MLILGILLVAVPMTFIFIINRKEQCRLVVLMVLSIVIGVGMLIMTVPSAKSMILRDFDVVKGDCVIEITSSGRAEADITMVESGEYFSFRDVSKLDVYGKAVPYYCEVTATTNHQQGVYFKVFDAKTHKLISSND